MSGLELTVGIETSGQVGGIALLRGETLIGERTLGESGRRHARTLIAELDLLLRTAGVNPRQVEHVAVSIGPGSFTGLRVGVVAAKTWGFVTGARLTAVETFEAIAISVPLQSHALWVVDDALRGEAFVQQFRAAEERWTPCGPVRIQALDTLLENVGPGDAVAGPGAAKWQADFSSAGIRVADAPTQFPTAAAIARRGIQLAIAGEFTDPLSLAPMYIRRSAAEEKMDALSLPGSSP